MEYKALYRKLRPKNFNQVIGQENIIKTLKNQIKANRINHAYLFCGTRGTGKTSTAKIFAKLVNCENPINLEPCEKCESCQAIIENRSLNVIEIDAASNNGVDHIRGIKEEIKYSPTTGIYKVYIIDEVHMLSIGAFNALLKTLEEPPNNVIFILATTDPQKIPVTILSRCQRFDFKRISQEDISNALKSYAIQENININDDAIKQISKVCDGAMRDAISLLDQCNSFYFNEEITVEKVSEITSTVDDQLIFMLAEALIEFDIKTCLDIINDVISQGREIYQLLNDILTHFRDLLMINITNGEIDSINIYSEKIDRLKEQSKFTTIENIIKIINILSELQPNLRQNISNKILFEMCCIKICTSSSEQDLTDVFNKIRLLEEKIENKQEFIHPENTVPEINKNIIPVEEEIITYKRELAISEDFKNIIKNWNKIISKFEAATRVILQEARPENLEDNFLYIVFLKEIYLKKIKREKEKVEKIITEFCGKDCKIYLILKEEFENKKNKVISKPKYENLEEDINNTIVFDVDYK